MASDTSVPPVTVTGPAGRLPDGRMPLVEHLRELRNRLGKSLLAIFAVVVAVFLAWEPVFAFLRQPYLDTVGVNESDQLFAFGAFEQFAVRLRVSFIGGVVLASPVWLYQLGAFITPALHRKERRYAFSFLGAGLFFFACGVALAYLTVALGLEFLLDVGGGDITTLLSVQSYLSFLTLTLLAFGVAFEFPVVVTFLNIVGLFPSQKMRAWRRGMIVALFAFAAVITPSQDPFTFTIMGGVLYLLYEGCIVLARVRERGQRRLAAAAPGGLLDDDTPSPRPLPPAPEDR